MSRVDAPTLAPGDTADITLLLEGTYPFVAGGVSTWVHQIISGMPELRFSLVFIGSSRDRCEKMRYELPANVVHFEKHFLAETPRVRMSASGGGDAEFFENSARLHDAFRGEPSEQLVDTLEKVVRKLVENPARHQQDFLFSERAWSEIGQRYERASPDRSFLEYFWTIRSMHAPLFIGAQAAARVPPSRAFHVVSTGFAGFLAMLLCRRHHRPLVLTEHGIYTKERRIELLQANWIDDDDQVAADTENLHVGFFRQLWIRFFERLGKMTYEAADPIVALYEGNRARQIRDGAPAARTRVVPNGIDLGRFAPLRSRRAPEPAPVLALIGRVVPIKDIKTFVRAMRIVCGELARAEGWIVGPDDEDPSYAEECRHLVASLRLTDRVKFLGFRRVEDVLPEVGLNVLTSISEAQPLVVLEGFAAGVPCVTTDVGCCRELVEGASPEDREIGRAGDVVAIADPEATARSALALLSDRARWSAAQRAGILRTERFYSDDLMLERYRAIYGAAMKG